MKSPLLHKAVREFVAKNHKKKLSPVIFKGSPFPEIPMATLAQQLSGKKKSEKKLPTWYKNSEILYPPTLNLEQSSSEITAKHKASLVDNQNLIDLTGGFGVDTYFFSKKVEKLVYCEINAELSALAKHNFEVLGATNIKVHTGNGMEFLKNSNKKFEWIYLDPSRRSKIGQKVVLFSQCEPNVPDNLHFLLKKSENLLIKSSPIIDLKAGISELKNVAEIYIVGVENEVKELLWKLKPSPSKNCIIKTINFTKKGSQLFESALSTEHKVVLGPPETFLYEPNACLMKSGLFSEIGAQFQLKKLHPNSHLFTSDKKIEFPGRRFRITEVLPYNSKKIKNQLAFQKANLSIRNFPISVAQLRKKFNWKEGGSRYVFFTTTGIDEKIVLICEKLT